MLTPAEARHLEMLALHYQEAVHQLRGAQDDDTETDTRDWEHDVEHTLGTLIGAAYTYVGRTPRFERFEEIANAMQYAQDNEHSESYASILGSIQALTERP